VNDYPEGDDLPIIDVRSPADRAPDAGRGGLGRMQQRVRDNHLDIAALLWMICVAGVLAVEIYSAVRSNRFEPFGRNNGWFTATLLASTGGFELTVGCMVGIGLAAWVDSGPARAALVMAAIGGAWAFVAGLIGVAVVNHKEVGLSFSLASSAGNRAVASFGMLLQGGLGVVVVLVALAMLTSGRAGRAPEPEVTAVG
jgi:hypothetical protein